jgi:hypothetical protein
MTTSNEGLKGQPASDDKHLIKLLSKNERLKVERSNALLRAEIASSVAPWWRKATTVTTLAALFAAVIPITTAIQGHLAKTREMALQTSKQDQELPV